MEKIQEHLRLIFKNSLQSQKHFVNKNQNEVGRFIFCGLEKVNKISLAILRLYHQLDDSEDLEFSLGILARSVLMDMILTLGIKKIFFKYDGSNLEEIRAEIKELCYKLINDGTNYFVEEIFSSEKLTPEEKKDQSKKFTGLFSKAFETPGEKPKLKKDFRFTLSDIYKESKHERLIARESIYNLYSYYSKYDHLSHWTSLAGKIDFDKRKEKLDLSIILMLMHLRDLLSIAYDYDDSYKVLEPYLTELQSHLQESYNQEIDVLENT